MAWVVVWSGLTGPSDPPLQKVVHVQEGGTAQTSSCETGRIWVQISDEENHDRQSEARSPS